MNSRRPRIDDAHTPPDSLATPGPHSLAATSDGPRARVAVAACAALAALLVLLLTSCAPLPPLAGGRSDLEALASPLDLGPVPDAAIGEASGLVASRRNRDVLWTHNDSGHPNRIYALSTSNRYLGAFDVDGCPAGDWEDIAAGPGPVAGVDYLYIANIGDNRATREERIVCRVPEPIVDASRAPISGTLTGSELIRIRYPDGPRDAETLLVDPQTPDIYVVSKREPHAGVYRARYPQSTRGVQTLERVTSVPFGQVVAGDISADGSRLLLKTYSGIHLFYRRPGQTWDEALSGPFATLPYQVRIAEEAIAWHRDGIGYFTLAENALGVAGRLYLHSTRRP